jgi:hypothetical protein
VLGPIALSIAYAHCTWAVDGKPDTPEFSRYEWRSVEAEARPHLCPVVGYQVEIRVAGETVAWGDDLNEAVGFADYALMADSRRRARENGRAA